LWGKNFYMCVTQTLDDHFRANIEILRFINLTLTKHTYLLKSLS